MRIRYSALCSTGSVCECIVILAALVTSVAGTSGANQQKSYNNAGCLRIDDQKPSVYLSRDADWSDIQMARMILHNNSTCAITLETTGKQLVMKPGGKLFQLSAEVAEDGALVTLRYKTNSEKAPWAFMIYWPYGDSLATLKLNGGHSVKFVVPSEYLRAKRQIAVPFYYEWDIALPRQGIEHLVYSIPIPRVTR